MTSTVHTAVGTTAEVTDRTHLLRSITVIGTVVAVAILAEWLITVLL